MTQEINERTSSTNIYRKHNMFESHELSGTIDSHAAGFIQTNNLFDTESLQKAQVLDGRRAAPIEFVRYFSESTYHIYFTTLLRTDLIYFGSCSSSICFRRVID